jgi:tetratricopeptide (TPR) repeat protein
LASLLAYLGLGAFVIYSLIKRQFGSVAYGVFFFLASLLVVSNLIFPIGTNLAERFAFMPSVGFCIAVVGLSLHYFTKKESKKTAVGILGAVLLIFSFRTLVRNFDFESNMTLYSKDIQVAENSAKAQNALGALIAEDALKTTDPSLKTQYSNEALVHLNKALEIHPTYLEAFYMRGNVNFMLGKVEEAVNDYRKCLALNPNFKNAYGNYALALRGLAKGILDSNGDAAKAIEYLEESLKLYPNEQETARLLEFAKAKQANPSGN